MIFGRKSGAVREPRLDYQRQDSGQTLAEGLEEYYRANAGRVTRPDDLPQASLDLFRSHDICHVIFGLDTEADDEAMVDTRTLLSSDVGVRRYIASFARDQQMKAIFKQYATPHTVWMGLLATPRMCRAFAQASRMTKRWPWIPPRDFLDRALSDLRAEFGIRII